MRSLTFDEAFSIAHILPRQGIGNTTAGSASQQSKSLSSVSSLLSTLAPVAVYSLIFLILFFILRKIFPRIYRPRTFVQSLPSQERSPELPKTALNFAKAFFRVPDNYVLNKQETLDGYLFLRLFKLCIISCLVGVIITWPILLPVNATGAGNRHQLNILTFANVASHDDPESYYRYYAHVLCAYIYFGYIMYAVTRESLYYVNLRQAYLVSPLYSNRVSSRTVLFQSVPNDCLKEDVLRELLGRDLVKNIWIPLDTDKLEEEVEKRDDMLMKLESAEVDLIKMANKARDKALKEQELPSSEQEQVDRVEGSGSEAAKWIPSSKRPTHRTKLWGLFGRKVDTIDWCREKLPAQVKLVQDLQDKHRRFEGKTKHTAFVEFYTLQDAQSAYQALTHHQPMHMAPRFTGIYPEEIIWYNLRIRWWERVLRVTAATTLVTATIIFWSFPVALIGGISAAGGLTEISGFHWLDFINHLGPVSGLIEGLIPVVLLSALMSILPVFLRLMARLAGDPTRSLVEYSVQRTYFYFYVLQGFIVTTLSSGIIRSANQLVNDPISGFNILAKSLPEAANFYLSFFILQGLGIVSQILLQPAALIVYYALGRIMDNTARKKFKRFINLSKPSLGTFYPIYTTLFVIALCYACIAPLVTGFALLGFLMLYAAYRYQFIYVFNVQYDTKGLMYARALQQFFVGLYLAEACLIGLFIINLADSNGGTRVLGPLILSIFLLVITLVYHISLNYALTPLLHYLPKTVETEERRLLAQEADEATQDGDSERGKGLDQVDSTASAASSPGHEKELPPTPTKQKKPNFIQKWLRPDRYHNYHALRRLVPRDEFRIEYPEETEKQAYFHPSVVEEPDVLWIPRDDAGVSKQEVRDTSQVTPITDEMARLVKGKIVWDAQKLTDAPIYKPHVYY